MSLKLSCNQFSLLNHVVLQFHCSVCRIGEALDISAMHRVPTPWPLGLLRGERLYSTKSFSAVVAIPENRRPALSAPTALHCRTAISRNHYWRDFVEIGTVARRSLPVRRLANRHPCSRAYYSGTGAPVLAHTIAWEMFDPCVRVSQSWSSCFKLVRTRFVCFKVARARLRPVPVSPVPKLPARCLSERPYVSN